MTNRLAGTVILALTVVAVLAFKSEVPRTKENSFLDDGPTSKLIRQILGAVSEFDKAMIVAKLKGARDRARRARGKCEGRKAYAERKGGHELVAFARQLRGNLDGQPQPLRKIAADLADRGCVTPSGRPYSASAIASMLAER